MRSAAQAALQVDIAGIVVVLESFLRGIVDSRDHTDVVIAAGAALEELSELTGQELGKPEIDALKPI